MSTRGAVAFASIIGLLTAAAALQLYALVGPDMHDWPAQIIYTPVIIPSAAILLALVTGHRHLVDRKVSTRALVSLALGTATAAAVGMLANRVLLFETALTPMLACAALVEVRTRAPRPPTRYTEENERCDAMRIAMLLGALTALAGLLAEWLTHGESRSLITIIASAFLPAGLLAGAALGAPFGALAHSTRHDAVWVRRLALSTTASELVFAAVTLTRTHALLAPALFATIAGSLYLERRTRATPTVPAASAMRDHSR